MTQIHSVTQIKAPTVPTYTAVLGLRSLLVHLLKWFRICSLVTITPGIMLDAINWPTSGNLFDSTPISVLLCLAVTIQVNKTASHEFCSYLLCLMRLSYSHDKPNFSTRLSLNVGLISLHALRHLLWQIRQNKCMQNAWYHAGKC